MTLDVQDRWLTSILSSCSVFTTVHLVWQQSEMLELCSPAPPDYLEPAHPASSPQASLRPLDLSLPDPARMLLLPLHDSKQQQHLEMVCQVTFSSLRLNTCFKS